MRVGIRVTALETPNHPRKKKKELKKKIAFSRLATFFQEGWRW